MISSSAASTDAEGEVALAPEAAKPEATVTAAGLATVVDWPDDPAVSDGRLARGQRTRRNVAEGLVALLRVGELEPTARAVAKRSGVSLRLVFHHFDDLDDLYAYVASLEFRRQWSARPRVSPKLGLATRIERTVAHRAALFEDISPVRRALARRAATSRDVAMALTSADALLQEDLITTFAPELEGQPEGIRTEYLHGMDTIASWEAWERMRQSGRLPARVARQVVARTLRALCEASDAVPARKAGSAERAQRV